MATDDTPRREVKEYCKSDCKTYVDLLPLGELQDDDYFKGFTFIISGSVPKELKKNPLPKPYPDYLRNICYYDDNTFLYIFKKENEYYYARVAWLKLLLDEECEGRDPTSNYTLLEKPKLAKDLKYKFADTIKIFTEFVKPLYLSASPKIVYSFLENLDMLQKQTAETPDEKTANNIAKREAKDTLMHCIGIRDESKCRTLMDIYRFMSEGEIIS